MRTPIPPAIGCQSSCELYDVAGSVATPEPHNYGCSLVLAQQPIPYMHLYLLLEIVRVLRINVLLRRWSYTGLPRYIYIYIYRAQLHRLLWAVSG